MLEGPDIVKFFENDRYIIAKKHQFCTFDLRMIWQKMNFKQSY